MAVRAAVVLRKAAARERVHAIGTYKAVGVKAVAEGVHTPASDGLLASTAGAAGLLVIVLLAEGLALLGKERLPIEGPLAVVAGEALDMPLPVECVDDGASSSRLAAAAAGRRHVGGEAAPAVGHARLLEELSSWEGLEAVVAHKALHMPLPLHCSDATVGDGFVAEGTAGAEHVLVASVARRLAIRLVEGLCAQRLLTAVAHEVLWVIRVPQRLHHVSMDRLVAECTNSLGRCHSVVDAAHLLVERAE